jgi:hypothetical protein
MELEAPATVVGASCSRVALGALELEAPATVVYWEHPAPVLRWVPWSWKLRLL